MTIENKVPTPSNTGHDCCGGNSTRERKTEPLKIKADDVKLDKTAMSSCCAGPAAADKPHSDQPHD